MSDSTYTLNYTGAEINSHLGITSKAAASGGTDESLVTTGEKYNWDNKATKPTKKSISLSTTWSGSGPYTQTVTVYGYTITANSKIDLQPNATTVNQLITDGVKALYIENNNSALTAYAIGAAPTATMTIQCTIAEVNIPMVVYINFGISGSPYQAEEGMTWGDWVNSSYNTTGFYIAGQSVHPYNSEMTIAYTNGYDVSPTEQINNNESYVYKSIGGGLVG